MIKVQNIAKTYKRRKVVQNATVEIDGNRSYFLIGPNGSGKSTLLNVIIDIVMPDSGTVISSYKKFDIGSSLSKDTFHPHLNAFQNLRYFARICGIKNYKVETHPLYELITKYLEKKRASKFSSGMKKILSVSIAMINNPRLLILDEPFNFLDPYAKSYLSQLLIKMQNAGTCLLVTTHDLIDIEDFEGECIFIDKGEIVHQANIITLLDESQTMENAYNKYISL